MTVRLTAPSAPRTRVIAVGGAKGSPGCTFVAVGLARCLAERGLQTLLVDADGEEAGVAAALGLAGSRRGGLARVSALGLDPDLLRDAGAEAGPRLRALELGVEEPPLDGREVVAASRHDHAAVVLDLGHAWTRLQRQIAAAADWLLWVLVPDRQGLERADRRLAALAFATGGGLVVNRAGRWTLSGADRALIDRHGLPLVARFPEHLRAARQVSERGVAAHRLRSFRGGFERIARTVHPDLEGGRTWL